MPRWIWLISSYTRKHTVKLSLFMHFTAQVRSVNQSDYSTNILILNIYIYICQWHITQNGNMQSRASKLHLTFILSLLSPPVHHREIEEQGGGRRLGGGAIAENSQVFILCKSLWTCDEKTMHRASVIYSPLCCKIKMCLCERNKSEH